MAARKPTTMNISLPASMRKYVQQRLERGGFGNASEYVRHLIREDQKREAQERIEAALLEGLNSGPPIPVDEKFWAERRAKLEKLAKRARRAKAGWRGS